MEYKKKMKKNEKYFQKDWKNPNYMTIGAENKTFYSKKMVFYVHFIDKSDPNHGPKKQIMGPYNQKTADIIMSQMLKKGHCCWIEESIIR